MTQQEFDDLDAFTRNLYETVATMNTLLHNLAHKVLEIEARLEKSTNPFGLPR